MIDLDAITKISRDFDRMVPKSMFSGLTKNPMLGAIQNLNEPLKALPTISPLPLNAILPEFSTLSNMTAIENLAKPLLDIPKVNFPELTPIQKAAEAWRVPLNGILKQGTLAKRAIAEHEVTLSAISKAFEPISMPTPGIISAISSFQKDMGILSGVAKSAATALALNQDIVFDVLRSHREFVHRAAEQLACAEIEVEVRPSLTARMKLYWTQMSLRKQILSILFWALFSEYILIPFSDPIIGPPIKNFACGLFPERYAPCIDEREERQLQQRMDHLEKQLQKDRAINRLRFEICKESNLKNGSP